MTTLIQFNRITSLLAAFLLVCLGLSPGAQAVLTDAEDYFPGGNTAAGQGALLNVKAGMFNTAIGFVSLNTLLDGTMNTAVGAGTLYLSTGNNNTAIGAAALMSNATGQDNTANGTFALRLNVEGDGNTAVGSQALASNTDYDNSAIGFRALTNNTTGHSNTGIGLNALLSNTGGSFNTGMGRDTLGSNMTGNSNTAVGYGALFTNTTGSSNIALGAFSGKGVTTGYNIICIGNGVLGDNVNNSTWVGNVYGVTTQSGTTAPVVVSDGGQLGIVASSQRFKKDIVTMDKLSEVILSLRPVTFHYKTDPRETSQFGLIAEEVAKVNPALVLPDKEGKPYTVRYDQVNAMLLNEFLKEHRMVQKQGAMIARQQKQIEALTTAVQKVSAQLQVNGAAPRTVLNNQ